MEANFEQSLRWVLKTEGGFVNDPEDNGGATNRGVTQRVYNRWRRRHNLPIQSVRDIKEIEVEAIYRNNYWDLVAGDDLPGGLDYCVFDFAVNSGEDRAAQFLQHILGAVPDGAIGPKTLAMVGEHTPRALIDQLCQDRADWLRTLHDFPHFGKGWISRVDTVKTRAESLLDV